MNILILTGRFGMGHVKAAEAIRETILASDIQTHVNIVDFTEYLFPSISEQIYSGFTFLTSRCSQVYNYFNRAADHYGRAPFQKALLGKIDRLLAFYRPDLIVATLPFCGQYISAYKKARSCTIPLYTYITDITVHEEWISSGTDLYFVGSPSARDALISRGVSPDISSGTAVHPATGVSSGTDVHSATGKIIISGIPVRQAFRPVSTSAWGKGHGTRHRLNVLIMGGGLGMISCSGELLQALNEAADITTTIITGRNVQLARELRETWPYLHVIGYTEDVHRYMKEADILITKPGGITTFEAIACRTPLFILPPALQQEKGNAHFIEQSGIGYILWDKNMPAAEILLGLLKNPEQRETMRNNMAALEQSFLSSNPLDYFKEIGLKKCC